MQINEDTGRVAMLGILGDQQCTLLDMLGEQQCWRYWEISNADC